MAHEKTMSRTAVNHLRTKIKIPSVVLFMAIHMKIVIMKKETIHFYHEQSRPKKKGAVRIDTPLD
jgi:hypothetical protein